MGAGVGVGVGVGAAPKNGSGSSQKGAAPATLSETKFESRKGMRPHFADTCLLR